MVVLARPGSFSTCTAVLFGDVGKEELHLEVQWRAVVGDANALQRRARVGVPVESRMLTGRAHVDLGPHEL